METMRVKVTAQDIAAGCAIDTFACPVALAIRIATKEIAFVGLDRIQLGERTVRRIVKTPARVARFIEAFDAGRPVKPFAFTLKVPA